MKFELMGLGYSKDDIMYLTPEKAHYILNNNIKKE